MRKKSLQEDTEAVLIRSAAEAIPEVLAQSRRDHVELLHVNCEGCEYDALLGGLPSGKRLHFAKWKDPPYFYKPTINHPYFQQQNVNVYQRQNVDCRNANRLRIS